MIDTKAIAAALLQTVREWVEPAFKGMATRVDDMEKRIEALERRKAFKYMGPHYDGAYYNPGEFVSLGGSMWHCNEPTTARPGDSSHWTLAVKHGRDLR